MLLWPTWRFSHFVWLPLQRVISWEVSISQERRRGKHKVANSCAILSKCHTDNLTLTIRWWSIQFYHNMYSAVGFQFNLLGTNKKHHEPFWQQRIFKGGGGTGCFDHVHKIALKLFVLPCPREIWTRAGTFQPVLSKDQVKDQKTFLSLGFFSSAMWTGFISIEDIGLHIGKGRGDMNNPSLRFSCFHHVKKTSMINRDWKHGKIPNIRLEGPDFQFLWILSCLWIDI